VPSAKKRIRRQSGAKKVTALLQIALPAEHMRACLDNNMSSSSSSSSSSYYYYYYLRVRTSNYQFARLCNDREHFSCYEIRLECRRVLVWYRVHYNDNIIVIFCRRVSYSRSRTQWRLLGPADLNAPRNALKKPKTPLRRAVIVVRSWDIFFFFFSTWLPIHAKGKRLFNF